MSEAVNEEMRRIAEEFGKRFEKARRANPKCVPFGELTWIAKQFQERFGEKISLQSLGRWRAGAIRPREPRCVQLAEILGVDPNWLYSGTTDEATTASIIDLAKRIADSALSVLEVYQAKGIEESHSTKTLRKAIADFEKVVPA